MKNKSLITVLIIIAVVAGVIYVSNKDIQEESAVTQSSRQEVARTKVMEAYRNEQFGIEVSHPVTYEKPIGLYGIQNESGEYVYADVVAFYGSSETPLGVLYVNTIERSSVPIEEFITGATTGLFSDYQKTMFGDKDAYEGVAQQWDGFYYELVVKSGAYIYELALTAEQPRKTFADLKTGLTDEQKQFITSFKFTK